MAFMKNRQQNDGSTPYILALIAFVVLWFGIGVVFGIAAFFKWLVELF